MSEIQKKFLKSTISLPKSAVHDIKENELLFGHQTNSLYWRGKAHYCFFFMKLVNRYTKATQHAIETVWPYKESLP